jgi:hypothetical protein
MESDALGEETASAADWDNRRLCSDGNCIGVIGPDGRCTECGKPGADRPVGPAAGSEPVSGPEPAAGDPADGAGDSLPQKALPVEAPAGADDWDSRRLCSDDNCIGVIGPDGRCQECGKPYAG